MLKTWNKVFYSVLSLTHWKKSTLPLEIYKVIKSSRFFAISLLESDITKKGGWTKQLVSRIIKWTVKIAAIKKRLRQFERF